MPCHGLSRSHGAALSTFLPPSRSRFGLWFVLGSALQSQGMSCASTSVNSSHCPPACGIIPRDEGASFEPGHPFANVPNLLASRVLLSCCLGALRGGAQACFRKPTCCLLLHSAQLSILVMKRLRTGVLPDAVSQERTCLLLFPVVRHAACSGLWKDGLNYRLPWSFLGICHTLCESVCISVSEEQKNVM